MSDNTNTSSNSSSLPGQIASNLSREAETTIKSIEGIVQSQQAVAGNENASDANKAAATVLAGAEGALATVGTVLGAGTKIADSMLVPLYQKLSFLKGIASLPVLKQMDPVMGVDVHNVIIPPSPVVPMPHPYIGMLFRPKYFVTCQLLSVIPTPPAADPVTTDSTNDEITEANINKALNVGHMGATMALGMMGASVKIGFMPRAVAGTPTKSVPHIPMGTGFSPPFSTVQKNVGHAFLGSLFVNADGDPLSGAISHLHNDCWDVGAKNLHSEDGVLSLMRFYVPSGIMTSIPQGRPVLVNPVPTPFNPSTRMNKLFKAGLGKLNKVFRKNFQKLLNKIAANPKLKKAMGGCPGLTKLSKKFGTGVSHPADVASGHFYTDNVDFSFPGVIPVEFERTYYSYSDYRGPLGIGWHHRYDMALAFDEEEGLAALRMEDGRTTGFEIPSKGSFFFNRREKLWLHRTEEDTYYITDTKGLIYRFTEKTYENPYNKSESHLLQSISNRSGYSLRLEYHRDAVLKRMTDTAGREILFESDDHGHITAVTAPAPEGSGRVTVSRYSYDSEGRLTSQTDALGGVMRFQYDGTLMTRETWRSGLSWHIFYDGRDKDAKCIEITGDQNLMHYKLDYVSSSETVVTNSLGDKTVYIHRRGFVIKRIEPNGGEYEFIYNPENELEWTRDPLGNGTNQTHDEWGNIMTRTEADSGFTYIQYENIKFPYLPTSAIDSVGGRWSWEYDEASNLIKRIDPLKAETRFEYTDGLLTTITGSEGERTILEYDLSGNLIKTVSPDGGINRWWYDAWGNCVKYENAKNGLTEYRYDLVGNVKEIKEPDGNIRTLIYDAEGNVIHAKDQDRDVRFTYCGVNKLSTRSERGATLHFYYDTEDRLKAVQNEDGERYTFKLDKQGDVIEEKGFDGLTRRYTRDLDGRVTEVEKPDGRRIAYEYDPVGRVTKVIYNPGKKDEYTEEYTYRRGDGALLKAINQDAEVSLERDILGRVIKETSNGESVISEYDLSGNRIRITSTLGAEIEAEYNLMGDLMSLSSGGWQSSYGRDLFGLETVRELMGGIRTETERDRLGRVTGHRVQKNNHRLVEKSYLWGTNDKLLGILDGSRETRFEYDGWGNLSKTVFEDGKTELRNPDRTGNLFESLDRMDRKYAKGGQLVKTDRWEYKYDKEGNLIRKKDKHGQVWRYEWNDAGMLSRVKRPDGMYVSFKYDALGRRIEKRFGKRVTKWLWDGNVPLNEERMTVYPDYSEEQGYFDRIERRPTITWVFEEGTFVPAAKLTKEEKLSIVTNYLGTPETMYSEEGETVWQCELNSYGKVREYKGDTKTDCPFRYQGQYEDAETGLYYNRFRYYSPDEGLFLSPEPIRLLGGIKLYSYVHDTNSYGDPLGLANFKSVDFSKNQDVLFNHKNAIIKIQMQGNRDDDFKEAFKRRGIDPNLAGNYTLHHFDDFNPHTGECTMQLVKTEAHIASLPHQGSVKQFADHFGIKNKEYGTYKAKELAYKKGWRKTEPRKNKPRQQKNNQTNKTNTSTCKGN